MVFFYLAKSMLSGIISLYNDIGIDARIRFIGEQGFLLRDRYLFVLEFQVYDIGS